MYQFFDRILNKNTNVGRNGKKDLNLKSLVSIDIEPFEPEKKIWKILYNNWLVWFS